MRFIGSEPVEGEPVQFLGVYALRWPWDSGVEPSMAFVEDNDPSADDVIAAIYEGVFLQPAPAGMTVQQLIDKLVSYMASGG